MTIQATIYILQATDENQPVKANKSKLNTTNCIAISFNFACYKCNKFHDWVQCGFCLGVVIGRFTRLIQNSIVVSKAKTPPITEVVSLFWPDLMCVTFTKLRAQQRWFPACDAPPHPDLLSSLVRKVVCIQNSHTGAVKPRGIHGACELQMCGVSCECVCLRQ